MTPPKNFHFFVPPKSTRSDVRQVCVNDEVPRALLLPASRIRCAEIDQMVAIVFLPFAPPAARFLRNIVRRAWKITFWLLTINTAKN